MTTHAAKRAFFRRFFFPAGRVRRIIPVNPLLLVFALALGAGAGTLSPALAQGQVSGEFGDWVLWCDTPPGAQGDQCALMQRVVAEDRSDMALDVVVLRTADRSAEILRVRAPLGVLLPTGLGLKIDDTDIGRAGFVRCREDLGCVAEVMLEDELLQRLETGTTATFIVFQTPEEGVGIPISLSGFREGFAALP
jgi:invasion protein IalB